MSVVADGFSGGSSKLWEALLGWRLSREGRRVAKPLLVGGRVNRIDSWQSLSRWEVGLIGSTRGKASLGGRSG